FDAGWSSPVARQAHNLKGEEDQELIRWINSQTNGSNPAPATRSVKKRRGTVRRFSGRNLVRHRSSARACCTRLSPVARQAQNLKREAGEARQGKHRNQMY